jgi:hypothetical protein
MVTKDGTWDEEQGRRAGKKDKEGERAEEESLEGNKDRNTCVILKYGQINHVTIQHNNSHYIHFQYVCH